MDELTRGLSLLGPKLEQLTRQIDQLGVQVTELRATVSKKADAAESEKLREQLDRLNGSLAHSQEAVVRQEHFNQLSASVQEMCSIVAAKGEAAQLEKLDLEMKRLAESMEKKAEACKVQELAEAGSPKPGSASEDAICSELLALKDTISGELKSLREAINGRAEVSLVEQLRGDLGELRDAAARKAESVVVDQLNERLRSLTTSFTQKAEFTEVEQLKNQVEALRGGAMQKAEEQRSDIKRVSQQLHEALSSAVATQEMEKKLLDVEQRLSDLDASKASSETLDSLMGQLKVLSDVLSPKIRATSPRPRSARGRVRQ